jgi:hypothetical protein
MRLMAGSFASVVFATGVFGCTTGQLLVGGLDDGGGPELDGQTSPEIDSGTVGDAPVDNDAAPDGYVGPCFISASDYDQSCSVDTDCIGVTEGDYCSTTTCDCGGSVIAVAALAKFNDDVARTPLGSGAIGWAECGCPYNSPPCCSQGICQLGSAPACAPPDTLPACADAGGTCRRGVVDCGQAGPPNSCAYADEACCIDTDSGPPATDGAARDSAGGLDGGTDADAASCMISASNYDQSCTADTDCEMVSSGDYCSLICLCGGSAINKGASAQFALDVSESPLGSGALGPVACSCPVEVDPCCRGGKCEVNSACLASPEDTLPACADAGGTCVAEEITPCSTVAGPPNSCAYADETCCLPAESDAGGCVDIEVSAAELECKTDQDCAEVVTGPVCPGYAVSPSLSFSSLCYRGAANSSGAARIEAQIAAIPHVVDAGHIVCDIAVSAPRCVAGQCTPCMISADESPACFDAGVALTDAGAEQ